MLESGQSHRVWSPDGDVRSGKRGHSLVGFGLPNTADGSVARGSSPVVSERWLECSHSLPAMRLLGNQLSPLRPCLLCSFEHVATLQCDAIFRKMGFVYRSPLVYVLIFNLSSARRCDSTPEALAAVTVVMLPRGW